MTNEKLINGGIKKILFMFLTTLCLLFCIYHPASAASAKTSIKVMTVGETCTVKKASLVKSSKNNVARVTKIGGSKYQVSILKKGKSTVKVYDKNGKLTKRIYLLAANNKSFNYDSTALYLYKGSSKAVKASSNISGVTVKYASSDESVATVDSAGKITAKKAGTSTIRARFYYKGECVRKISKKVYVYTSSYETTSISITAGNTKSVAPSVSSNCTVAYSSSDSGVASVSSKGVLTAKKKGTATVTTKVSVNGTLLKTYTIKVTVKAKSTGSSSTSSNNSSNSDALLKRASQYRMSQSSLTVDKGKSASIFCTTASGEEPLTTNAINSADTFAWKCSATSVVSISPSENTCKITGKSKGTATVTCVVNGLVSYTCKVTATVDNEVTVNGVTFDLNNFPKTLTNGGTLMVEPLSDIDPADITYEIANGKAELLCDYNTPNLHESYTEKYTHMYYVSDWNNMVAFVHTCYDPTFYYKYRCYVSARLKTGSFPVSVYYQGKLLRTCNVTINITSSNAETWRAWVDELEANAWTSGMTVEEKLWAIKSYIYYNYTYYGDGIWCNHGAAALLFAARDLGLKARYRFVGPNYDYTGSTYGYGDEYDHLGMAFCGGHVCTIITIDGKDWMYEANGRIEK